MLSLDSPSRRRYLTTVAVATVGAGCTRNPRERPDEGRYRLRVTNDDTITHNVQITIRRLSDGKPAETVFDETRAVGENGDSLDRSEYVSDSSD